MEGPYGAFTLDDGAEGAAFIAGGVGITPVISILRTLRDRGDRRPLRLVYGSDRWSEVLFRDELAELARDLDLEVVHVLEESHAGWDGPVGWIDAGILDRFVPTGEPAWEYFVCGPERMMDVAESWLLHRGVPMRRLNSERFNIA